MPSTFLSLLQALALLVLSLGVVAMFGVWRGFNPASFSPTTFVEVQQGAIRGLNDLLPAMGAIAIVTVLLLAFFGRGRPRVLSLYLMAAAAMIVAGLITHFGNQPINAVVMSWRGLPPAGWETLRESWWSWHLARLAAGFVGELLLIAGVFADRGS